MIIKVYAEPRHTSKGDKRYLYKDEWCTIAKDQSPTVDVFSFETDDKLCVIEGNIYITSAGGEHYSNIAELYLKEYSQKPESFLYISEGNFVLAEYDKVTHEIVIQKDILGLKHAYYTRMSYGFCLSTSIAPVLEFRKGNSSISIEGLGYYLSFQYLPQPYTIFSEVRQVPLHGSVKYKEGEVIALSYKGSYLDILMRHKADSRGKLGDLLAKSIVRQTKNVNKKIGAFLSGGMDTSSNVAILKTYLNIRPVVFTAGFREKEYDETPYAKIVAKAYGLEHHIFRITPDILRLLPDICALYDSPLADRAILPEYFVCLKAKEQGISHMITGEGGDEVLGYPRNLPEDAVLRSETFENNVSLASYYSRISALLQQDLRRKIMKIDTDGSTEYLSNLYEKISASHPFEKMYYGQWQTWMIDNVFMKDAQLFSYADMRFVSPYMDVALMKYFMQLDFKQKMQSLKNKNYLKKAMEDILPQEILYKSKHKFHVPIAEWLRTELYEDMHDLLLAQDSITTRYFDKTFILHMLEEHRKGRADYNRPLWALFFLEQWYRLKKSYVMKDKDL